MITKTKIIEALAANCLDDPKVVPADNFQAVADAILGVPVISECKWIQFIHRGSSESGKTSIYEVRTKAEIGYLLGEVKWYAAFRCYSFLPTANSIFEADCLNDITNFLEALNYLHKTKSKKA